MSFSDIEYGYGVVHIIEGVIDVVAAIVLFIIILWKEEINMIRVLIGLAIILFSIISVIVSVVRTPDNLRGWYGVMFGIIAIGGIVGGVCIMIL